MELNGIVACVSEEIVGEVIGGAGHLPDSRMEQGKGNNHHQPISACAARSSLRPTLGGQFFGGFVGDLDANFGVNCSGPNQDAIPTLKDFNIGRFKGKPGAIALLL